MPLINNSNIQSLLNGETAFYNQPDYKEATKAELNQRTPLPTFYKRDTESKSLRIAKEILSYIVFPIILARLWHSFVGIKAFLPATSAANTENAHQIRASANLDTEWKYKRLTLEVDGIKIDTYIVGKPSTLHNRKWVLSSIGNGALCEEYALQDCYDKTVMEKLGFNGIFFNYPGVAANPDLPVKSALVKAYKIMLAFLEDHQKGIGAKEIVGIGISLGGGVQGEGLKGHTFKIQQNGTEQSERIKYVFVKTKTFIDLASAAESYVVEKLKKLPLKLSVVLGKISKFLTKITFWNLSSHESSRTLPVPEIIVQHTDDEYSFRHFDPKDKSLITFDGFISAEASLAKNLMEDDQCPKGNKCFLGVTSYHSGYYSEEIEEVVQLIKANLAKQ